ncbi:AzlC family ABC transporter permease [Kitasatospora sp. NPDC048239]|uniref:AzlC family ABC transporter permease n=1 Tax=Kitasatospora sp. NPDC048239 TaxID=3364046 RepID=UPI0037164174
MATGTEQHNDTGPARDRPAILRAAAGIALAVGAYGLSYGALAVAAGLTVWQAQALSLLLYGGSSQLALVGVLASGGTGASATATAALLGVRNLFYGVGLARQLRPSRSELLPMAHLLSDESAAMAAGQPERGRARLAYWATGGAVFACWNLATLIGALAGSLLDDPKTLGLDAASSAAFLALVAPRLRTAADRTLFLTAGAVAVGCSLVAGSGLPVVVAGLTSFGALLIRTAPPSAPEPEAQPSARPSPDTDSDERTDRGDEHRSGPTHTPGARTAGPAHTPGAHTPDPARTPDPVPEGRGEHR